MSVSEQVNMDLRLPEYGPAMAKNRPGSPRGQPKPLKRVVDQGFPDRLRKAMTNKGVGVPEVAKLVGCTRQVIHKYLGGETKTLEALLLFDLSAALEVSPEWLLTGRTNKHLELVRNKEDRPRGSPPLDSGLLRDAITSVDRYIAETRRSVSSERKTAGVLVLYENFIAGGRAEKATVTRILNLVYSASN